MKSYRQGDVRLIPVEAIPEGKEVKAQNGRLILALGEVTGHHHSVAVKDATGTETAEGIFLQIMAPTPLEHQEHAAIEIPAGSYKVIRQVEYRPGDLPRNVAD